MAGEGGRGIVPGHAEPALFDTGVAHCARVYDYWLGGKDNFAADRAAAEQAMRDFPEIVATVNANRAFLARAVRFLAGEAGISQFLDIGTGIPAAGHPHELAQSLIPQARVVYVDNDPIVLAHARALRASSAEGSLGYLDADLRDPERILAGAAQVLDFSRPVAVLLFAVLHHLDDQDHPRQIVATLMDAVVPGSYLALSHPAADLEPERSAVLAEGLASMLNEPVALRSRAAVAGFFDGLELAGPGLVRVPEWRPGSLAEAAAPAALWGGVARKP